MPQFTKTIILCADNDGMATNTKGPVLDAIQKWLDQGYQIKVALPFGEKLGDKYDFNDLLKQRGNKAVDKCLNEVIIISKISDFGERSLPLSHDFLKLKERSEQIKIEKDVNITNRQKIVDQQNLGCFER